MTTHVNKVHHVTTITQVARDLEEDEDWLWDIANEMEIEDGVIWVRIPTKSPGYNGMMSPGIPE